MKASKDNHRTKKLIIECIFLCFNIEDMKLVSLIFLVVHRYNLYPAHPCMYIHTYFLDLLTNSFMYQSQCVQCTLLLLKNCTVNISFCTTFLFVKKKFSMGRGICISMLQTLIPAKQDSITRNCQILALEHILFHSFLIDKKLSPIY